MRQTRMKGLIEISIENADPVLAANIANEIASSYKEARLELWQQVHAANIAMGRESLNNSTPSRPLVMVRDPARPERYPVLRGKDFLLMGVLGGTLLALVACGVLALFIFLRRWFSHRHIVRAIRVHPLSRPAFVRMFALVFLLCMLTSVLLSIWIPRRYSSMVRIEVEKDAPEALTGEARQAMIGPDPYFMTTQFKIIESYNILTNVIGKLRLDRILAQQNGFTGWTMDETFDYLSKRISVQQTRMKSLIEISTQNADPVLAANIANEIASSYNLNPA